MIPPAVRAVADAVLYEGYVLYPYRPSSVKNKTRWTFGGLHPRAYCEASGNVEPFSQLTDCLIEGPGTASVTAHLRFLHLVTRTLHPDDGPAREPWEEAEEREVVLGPVTLAELAAAPRVQTFAFEGLDRRDAVAGGTVERARRTVSGVLELGAVATQGGWRLTVLVRNETPFDPCEAGLRDVSRPLQLAGTHTVLAIEGGAFVSQQDPPAHFAAAAAASRNQGAWPVLAGEAGRRDLMLLSPIILYDHPRVAAESPGDLFDATEIDEILTLRILTLTDDEKREMIATEPRLAALLERSEKLGPEELTRLHGLMRPVERPLAAARVGGAYLSAGARVKLAPKNRADVMDLALAGKAATIAALEEDFDGTTWVVVVLDDDPGRDLGLRGEPGHRFFFRPEEVEPA